MNVGVRPPRCRGTCPAPGHGWPPAGRPAHAPARFPLPDAELPPRARAGRGQSCAFTAGRSSPRRGQRRGSAERGRGDRQLDRPAVTPRRTDVEDDGLAGQHALERRAQLGRALTAGSGAGRPTTSSARQPAEPRAAALHTRTTPAASTTTIAAAASSERPRSSGERAARRDGAPMRLSTASSHRIGVDDTPPGIAQGRAATPSTRPSRQARDHRGDLGRIEGFATCVWKRRPTPARDPRCA